MNQKKRKKKSQKKKKDEAKKEEEKKPEEKKDEPKKEESTKEKDNSKKVDGKVLLNEKVVNHLWKHLTGEELLKVSLLSKEFNKAYLPKIKEYNNQIILKEEKELEEVKADDKKLTEFSFGKAGLKAVENLNEESHIEYFKKDEVPNDSDILLCRICYQLINKEKDMLNVTNDTEFWKLFKEHILKNCEDKIGDYLKKELTNADFSPENADKVYSLCKGKEEKLKPVNKENTYGYIFFLVKHTLEYMGISIGLANKKLENTEAYQKYLEYRINKRKENDKKLEQKIANMK